MRNFPLLFQNPETLPVVMALFFVLIAWSIVWKGMALWTAARAGSKPWFVALLIVNTAGILDILYIFVFSRAKGSSASKPGSLM